METKLRIKYAARAATTPGVTNNVLTEAPLVLATSPTLDVSGNVSGKNIATKVPPTMPKSAVADNS
jgi:hypothetical protein